MYTVNFLAFLNCEIHLQIDKIWGFLYFVVVVHIVGVGLQILPYSKYVIF